MAASRTTALSEFWPPVDGWENASWIVAGGLCFGAEIGPVGALGTDRKSPVPAVARRRSAWWTRVQAWPPSPASKGIKNLPQRRRP